MLKMVFILAGGILLVGLVILKIYWDKNMKDEDEVKKLKVLPLEDNAISDEGSLDSEYSRL